MRFIFSLCFFTFLTSCQPSASPSLPAVAPKSVATAFVEAVFKQNNPQVAAELATGELKQKILNTSELELEQLKKISSFTTSNIKEKTKQQTGLSVVSMNTQMTLNGSQLKGEQHIVLTLIDNQWKVYHF